MVQELPAEVLLVQGDQLVLAAAPGLCRWTFAGLERRQGAARPVRVGPRDAELLVGATVEDRLEVAAVAPGEAELTLERRCAAPGERARLVREKALLKVVSGERAGELGTARLTGRLTLGRDGPLPRGARARVAAVAGGQRVPGTLEPPPPQVVALTRVDGEGAFELELPPGVYALVMEVEGKVIWEGKALRREGPPAPGVLLGHGQEQAVELELPAALLLELRRF